MVMTLQMIYTGKCHLILKIVQFSILFKYFHATNWFVVSHPCRTIQVSFQNHHMDEGWHTLMTHIWVSVSRLHNKHIYIFVPIGYEWGHLHYTHQALSLRRLHYSDVIMSAMTSQTTDVSIIYSSVCSGVYQRKHQSPASLAFVSEMHR